MAQYLKGKTYIKNGEHVIGGYTFASEKAAQRNAEKLSKKHNQKITVSYHSFGIPGETVSGGWYYLVAEKFIG